PAVDLMMSRDRGAPAVFIQMSCVAPCGNDGVDADSRLVGGCARMPRRVVAMRVLLGAVVAGLLFAVPASANVTVFTQNSGSDLEVDSLGSTDTQGQQMRVIIEQF